MKISNKNLAIMLAEKYQISEKKAYFFVKTLFETVREGIDEDGKVKIHGLGTFKVIDVEPRKSIDVNTQKEVIIKGHKKLTFLAEKDLAEKVNHRHADGKVEMGEMYVAPVKEEGGKSWFAKLKKKLFN